MIDSSTANAGDSAHAYEPRDLTRRELQKLDVHSFCSPKEEGRLVRVAPLANLALALRLEFNPAVTTYVERPRQLTCGSERYEFSFWYRESSGREYLPMLVCAPDSVPVQGGRRRHRHAEKLLASAQAAGLPLSFVQETDLIAAGQELSTYLRLLPSVQIAHRLPNRLGLRQAILELVGRFDRFRVSQVVTTLGGFAPPDVRSVVGDLLHAGLLTTDLSVVWHQHSQVWVPRS